MSAPDMIPVSPPISDALLSAQLSAPIRQQGEGLGARQVTPAVVGEQDAGRAELGELRGIPHACTP